MKPVEVATVLVEELESSEYRELAAASAAVGRGLLLSYRKICREVGLKTAPGPLGGAEQDLTVFLPGERP